MIYLHYFIYFIIIYAHWISTIPSSLTITLSIEDNTNDNTKKTGARWDYENAGIESEGKEECSNKQMGLLNLKCECGNRNNSEKIVGGKETVPHEFPWQVGFVSVPFGSKSHPFCGGSIISSMTILTAAHCVEGSKPDSLLVVVGEHDVSKNDGEVCLTVEKIIVHPKYVSRAEFDNDYALLIMKETIEWNAKVSPVCLPTGDASYYENIEAIVTGWGTLSSGGQLSPTLQKVTVKTITNEQCTTGTSYQPEDLSPNMICAAEADKDSCQGDSGGPLVAKEEGGYYSEIGVVSWGFGCAMADAPGVYARVTAKMDWIKENMEGDSCPAPGSGEKDVD